MAKMSCKSRSYTWAHRCSSVRASINWTVIRTLFPALRTLPSSSVLMSSSRPISATDFVAPLYFIAEVRAMTLRPPTFESVVMSSSVIPSAKYSSPGSRLILARGRTTKRCLSLATLVTPRNEMSPAEIRVTCRRPRTGLIPCFSAAQVQPHRSPRSEEHTSELQSQFHLVCRLLLEKKKERYRDGPFSSSKRNFQRDLRTWHSG